MIPSTVPPKFKVEIDYDRCMLCERCTIECSWGVLRRQGNRIVAYSNRCGACHRCVSMCPRDAIKIVHQPVSYRPHPLWTEEAREDIYNQAKTGCILLSGMANAKDFPTYFDKIVLDACQVTNPSIDPLREPMELRTYIGKRPKQLEFEFVEEGIDGKKIKKAKLASEIYNVMPIEEQLNFFENIEKKVEEEELIDVIKKELSNMTKREQLVIQLYYFEELSLKEISEMLGITESRISQIHKNVIKKIQYQNKYL